MFGLNLKILSKEEETINFLSNYYTNLNINNEINTLSQLNKYVIENNLFYFNEDIKYKSNNLLLSKDKITNLYNYTCKDINSSGLDIIQSKDITIPAKTFGFKIYLGIACEPVKIWIINDDDDNKFLIVKPSKSGYFLYPRSSLSKSPLRLSNSVGIIDSSYRGEIIACVDNTSDENYTIKKGERLFQLCSPNLEPVNYTIKYELSKTKRGDGGFGSTGK